MTQYFTAAQITNIRQSLLFLREEHAAIAEKSCKTILLKIEKPARASNLSAVTACLERNTDIHAKTQAYRLRFSGICVIILLISVPVVCDGYTAGLPSVDRDIHGQTG